MNILMIEDNHSVCEMMAMFLKSKIGSMSLPMTGWKRRKVNAAPDKWDVILLDLNLPKKDGMQVGCGYSASFADGTADHADRPGSYRK